MNSPTGSNLYNDPCNLWVQYPFVTLSYPKLSKAPLAHFYGDIVKISSGLFAVIGVETSEGFKHIISILGC